MEVTGGRLRLLEMACTDDLDKKLREGPFFSSFINYESYFSVADIKLAFRDAKIALCQANLILPNYERFCDVWSTNQSATDHLDKSTPR